MSRWFLAVFAFQLFWNMAGFTLMEFPGATAAAQSVSMSITDAHDAPGKGLSDQAHGLLDELPDLPDGVALRSAPKQGHTLLAVRPWFMLAELPPPALGGLLRPPQGA